MRAIRITKETQRKILESPAASGYGLEEMDWNTRIQQGVYFIENPHDADWMIVEYEVLEKDYLYLIDPKTFDDWFNITLWTVPAPQVWLYTADVNPDGSHIQLWQSEDDDTERSLRLAVDNYPGYIYFYAHLVPA